MTRRALVKLGAAPFDQLQTLDLSECVVSDDVLESLAGGREDDGGAASSSQSPSSSLRELALAGCLRITHHGLVQFARRVASLKKVWVSGCYYVDGRALSSGLREVFRTDIKVMRQSLPPSRPIPSDFLPPADPTDTLDS